MCRHSACVIIKAMQLMTVPATALLLPHRGTQLLPTNAQKAIGDGDVAHFVDDCPAITRGPQRALLAPEETDHKRTFNRCKQALNFALAAADAGKGTGFLETLTKAALEFGRSCNSMKSQSVCGDPPRNMTNNPSVLHLQGEALPPGGSPVGAILMATNPERPKPSGRHAHQPTRVTKNTKSHAWAALVQEQAREIQALKSQVDSPPTATMIDGGGSAVLVEAMDVNSAAPVVVPAIPPANSAHMASNDAVAGSNNAVAASNNVVAASNNAVAAGNNAVPTPPPPQSKPPACFRNVVVGRRLNDDTGTFETMVCPSFPHRKDDCVLVLDGLPEVDVGFLMDRKLHIELHGKVMVPRTYIPPKPQNGFTHPTSMFDSLVCWPVSTRKKTIEANKGGTTIVVGPGTATPADMANNVYDARHGWKVIGCNVPGLQNFAEGGELGVSDSLSDIVD